MMHPDLERLIRLQDLDTTVQHARRQIAESPGRQAAFEVRLADQASHVTLAKSALTENQTTRRASEKDLAAVQTRLSNYKNQLMSVKTNREYQAMQTEIAAAEHEVQQFEDVILACMLEADELQRAASAAEATLEAEEAAVEVERAELDRERQALERELDRAMAERQALATAIGPQALALFDHVARGRGTAMSQAKDGLCTACHVRLRPQVYNEVVKNTALIQCENCQRILYFVPAATAP